MQPCLPEIVRRLRAHRWGSLPDSRAWHAKGCCDANVAAEARCGQRLTRGRTEVQSRARTGRQTCFPTRPVPPPRRPSHSAGVGRGTEGETPVAQHPHLHAQHLWVPAPTCPPARHRPDISTSPHSPPASPGLALQPDTLLFCIVMLGGASFIISVPLLSGRGRERGGGSWGWKEESANQPLRGFG